ncbi:MAG: inositol monophosphatase [Saprospiraceae bacterium]|nr:inositol monophosphatase [Saprospiraceae bacterium]
MEWLKICEQALPKVQQVGKFIVGELGKVQASQVEDKSVNSLVSYVDKQAEIQLVEALQQILPTATFITEEATIENSKSELTWIIDPLDGTTNFLHGIPCFSVSVGLQCEGQLVVGIVLEPTRNEMFYAAHQQGAFLNGNRIKVRQNATFANSLIAIGFPYNDGKRVQQMLSMFETFQKESRGIRRLGSAALDLAYTAAGRFDAYFEGGINAWDIAGGALLVKEAGGIVTDYQGGDDFLFSGEIIAATPSVYDRLKSLVLETYY